LSKARLSRSKRAKAIIDVRLQDGRRVRAEEFASLAKLRKWNSGDAVRVFLLRLKTCAGEAVLSPEMRGRENLGRLEKAIRRERVEGAIFGRVKGGFTLNLGGAVAFLPVPQLTCAPCAMPAL